jgi:hypothetical protein
MMARLGEHAGGLTAAAGAYQGQEKGSAGKLGEGAEDLGKIGQFMAPMFGVAGQMTQAAGSMIGNVSQAVTYPVTGVVGAVSAAGINANHTDHKDSPGNGPGSVSPTETHSNTPEPAAPPAVRPHEGHQAR